MINLFGELIDFRRGQGRRHGLGPILFYSVLGILCGSDSYRKIAIYIKEQFDVLNNKFEIKWKNPPSYSTIRNVIQGVSSEDLETLFRSDAIARLEKLQKTDDLLEFSFDGKVVRGSFDHFKDVKAIQVLSVFCKNYNLIMAHEEIAEKTNEIPVAQTLIPSLNFEDAIYTCDALNCQTETINRIVDTGNDFIVQVKNNQKSLLDDAIMTSNNQQPLEVYKETPEKKHGRITCRTASVFDTSNIRNKELKWDEIKCIVEVQRDRQLFVTKEKIYKDTSEISYYISTTILSAEKFNSIIRGHWAIENSNHYVRDVTFKEDASRIRVNPQNMVKLKSLAMNILRSSGVKNIATRLFENAINVRNLFKLELE